MPIPTPPPSNLWPAIWSAAAATCSFATGLLTYLLSRRNVSASVRPELVLAGWAYNDKYDSLGDALIIDTNHIKNDGYDLSDERARKLWAQLRRIQSNESPLVYETTGGLVTISSISNIGSGTAYDITVTCMKKLDVNKLNVELSNIKAIGSINYLNSLTSKQKSYLGFRASLIWRNALDDPPHWKILPFDVDVYYKDVFGSRYEVRYHLMAHSPPRQIGLSGGAVSYAWGLTGFRTMVSVTMKGKIVWMERMKKMKNRTIRVYTNAKETLARIYRERKGRPYGGP